MKHILQTFLTASLTALLLTGAATGWSVLSATAGPETARSSGTAVTISPPAQPATGPGGADQPWAAVRSTKHSFGNAALDYWIFAPEGWQGSGQAPASAPLVVFLHGWLGYNPVFYEDWINHLVRAGNIVIFPCYQAGPTTPPATFTTNALTSIHDALRHLRHAPVKPAVSQGMILVSHSWGGPIAANIANRWSRERLPRPRALLLAEPFGRSLDPSLSGIPATTTIDCVVGDADTTVGRTGCDAIWERIQQSSNHDYIWMFGDSHGTPGLVADHRAPTSNTTRSRLDALDWYGFWKLADALRDCTINATHCDQATGATTAESYMGDWSDGVPVHPLSISTTKPRCPAGSTAEGC